MDDSPVVTISPNLPEMLARDLAESESFFLARSRTAGPPAATLAFEAQPPHVPQRKPGVLAATRLHRTTSESDWCSLGQDSSELSTGRFDAEEGVHKGNAAPFGTLRTLRRMNRAGVKNFHLKMETDKDDRRVFLNGFDEDWGSDSSADMDTGMSSPSVRLRQQSITTAATSVDVQSVAGGKGTGGEASMFEGPENHHASVFQSDCESWVDLETAVSESEAAPERSRKVDSMDRFCYLSPADSSGAHSSEFEQKALLSVPQRRSSLSHQVTTAILDDNAPATHPVPKALTPVGPSSRSLLLSPGDNSQVFSIHPPTDEWNASEVASSPVVHTGRRQHPQTRLFQHDLTATPYDQLPPSPAPSSKEQYREASHNSSHHPQQSQHSLISHPRKSNSISRMPFLTQVNSWLEAGNSGHQRRYLPASPTSPVGGAPVANIRVSTEILENLRIMVSGFPDTMLSTECLTVQTIQNYARKLRIGDFKNERIVPRGSDELSINKSPTTLDFSSQHVDRKASFGNLKLMTSLRGKFSSRFASSPTSSLSRENSEEPWPPIDNRIPTVRCNSSPSRPSATHEKDRYITALRSIFPTGTDYLLDALYAHIIVYNYINALCGGFPHLHQNGNGAARDPLQLRSHPSTNLFVPAGVTSLADLQLQEDAADGGESDFYREFLLSSPSQTAVVPSKAAAMLGLGSTNMGQPVRPPPGTLGGRSSKLRKTTPPGASFAASLESEATLRHLRDNISRNIYRLVETVKSASSVAKGKQQEDDEDGAIMGPNGKELEPTLMRAMCEVVRCYEELNA